MLSVLREVIRRTHERALAVGPTAKDEGATRGAFVLIRRCQDLGGEAGACVSEWEDPSTPTGGHRMQSGVCVTHDRREG